MPLPKQVLVVSIGNPGALQQTYHSAGHIVVNRIQHLLGHSQPRFDFQRLGHARTCASLGSRYLLMQSPVAMNISGEWAAKAYKEQLQQRGLQPRDLGFVVVHDDLEEALGVVRVRPWDKSARGHNGLKSLQQKMMKPVNAPWARVSIGIGRPESRTDLQVRRMGVVDFVLSKVPPDEKRMLEGGVSEAALDHIRALDQRWTITP
ncbi:peptidyl-tRNA hydrolase [Dichotomopilus funicola]|uniref:peptidyl-tRNA hydrolase n=1 Tax=Dichotomopilus funicola TaxID=1934379 RepID=A0AAN6ZKT4_9PEZI|nr:peptidyl-tRNA hydrolase [Dichotomopilus funicola]